MPNPLIPQGMLNKIRGSLVWTTNPAFNITAPYLGKDGIRFTQEGDGTVYFPTMTGAALSQEPYVMVSTTVALLKTQPLADQYKQRFQTDSALGDFTVRPDASTLSPYQIINGSIEGTGDLLFNGTDPVYGVRLKGYYLINSALFDV